MNLVEQVMRHMDHDNGGNIIVVVLGLSEKVEKIKDNKQNYLPKTPPQQVEGIIGSNFGFWSNHVSK